MLPCHSSRSSFASPPRPPAARVRWLSVFPRCPHHHRGLTLDSVFSSLSLRFGTNTLAGKLQMIYVLEIKIKHVVFLLHALLSVIFPLFFLSRLLCVFSCRKKKSELSTSFFHIEIFYVVDTLDTSPGTCSPLYSVHIVVKRFYYSLILMSPNPTLSVSLCMKTLTFFSFSFSFHTGTMSTTWNAEIVTCSSFFN